ncbi:hypothetical protein F3Y22_tig00110017pilonHSYRG00208 [Hibiscus syriacus]|uniref:Pre-rRNA-processing protein RIX1 N-terminal domain-containing protein n=1 Tax=Hibiscus syriacus TaxID=106335 RepID=A0A6A3BPI4_HIBSY|nr:hypothetical protein F3Y22_tig00110017pilonHSYRG00208 [Hibiscus syriacus]
MLDYLMNDQIPDETDPSPQHCDLQRVVNAIRTLGLLSESKISEDWAVAFDSWLDRVLSLESSPRESLFDSVTVAKSLDRNMFTRGDLSRMQLRSAARMISSLVRKTRREYPGMSSPIGSIFYLLGKYSEIKKDVTVHAGKLVQPVLDHLLDNEFSEVEGALAVLCIVIDFLPASFLPHYEKLSHALQAEAVIVSKIVSGQCSSNMMKLKFTSMMSFNAWNKVIISALKAFDVFADDKRNEIMSIRHFLAPERAAYLEARKVQAYAAMHNPHTDALLQHNANEFLFSSGDSSGSSIINSCKESANGEWLFSRTSSKSMEIMQEGYGFIELPALQPCGLDLLSAIIKRTSSQLLPHAGYIIRLLKDCLKQCALTMLRTKLYFIIRTLLISIGIGAALQIAEELTISAESRDMDYSNLQNKSATSPLSLKIAALKAFQTLVTMGGVLRSDLQPSVDDLLMNVAEITYDGKWRNDEGVKQTRSRNKDCRFCGVALLALEKIMNPRNVSNGDIPKEGIKLNESQIPKSFPADQDESLLSYLRHGYNESEATLSNPEDRKQEAFLVDIEIKRNSDETVNEEQLQGPLSVAEVKPFRRKHE